MPGMMDTVLNLGLNDKSVKGLAKVTADERFAYDSYRRFISMYGRIVLGLDGQPFDVLLENGQGAARGHAPTPTLPAAELKELCESYKAIVKEATGKPFPQDPMKQLRGRGRGRVQVSWNGARAIAYRVRERISHDLGTAVNVQAMVFGNRDDNSGTGVGFTRNAATGENKPYGDFLVNAQGEDVVAGIRNTEDLDALEGARSPTIHAELLGIFARLEAPLPGHVRHRVHHRAGQALDAPDPGRQAHRRGRAAHGGRHDQGHRQGPANAGRSPDDEALMRVTADHLDQVLHPQFAGKGEGDRQGPRRVARRRGRQGVLHRRRRGRRRRSGRAGHPRAQRDAARKTSTG